MKTYPDLPGVDDAPPALLERGHLWIQELIDGGHLRVQLLASGVLRFGDRTRRFDPEAIPLPYRHAVRHVREHIDREALRAAVDDVESVVFFGEATFRRGVDYDWARIPPFLGFDVWTAADDRFLPIDRVEQVFDRLDLAPVNTFRKEVRAADFSPASYEVPDSAWYDGPAAGVVLRNKTGLRAILSGSSAAPVDPAQAVPADASAEELARRHATDGRIERIVRDLDSRGRPVSVDTVHERLFETIAREEHGRLFDGRRSVDVQAFRSELAAQTRRSL